MQKYWEVTVIWRSGFPSTVCLYMNSQHSESFKGALWNVSDSHGESLLQLKCFSRRPRYSLGMLENMECFFFSYIKRHVNKDSQHLQLHLAWVFQFTSGNLLLWKKSQRFDLEKKCRIAFISSTIYITFVFQRNSPRVSCARRIGQSMFSLSEMWCPSRRRPRVLSKWAQR